jgi:hypothetical protein
MISSDCPNDCHLEIHDLPFPYLLTIHLALYTVTSAIEAAWLSKLVVNLEHISKFLKHAQESVWIHFYFASADCWVLWGVSRAIQDFVEQESYICTSTERPWRDMFLSSQKLLFSPVAWLLQRQLPGCCRCPLKVSQCTNTSDVYIIDSLLHIKVSALKVYLLLCKIWRLHDLEMWIVVSWVMTFVIL